MERRAKVVGFLKAVFQEFQQDQASQLGAALAYYAMFSMFPLVLLLLAVLGFALRYWDRAIDVQAQLLVIAGQSFSPELSAELREALLIVRNQAGAATGVGLVTLLLGASGVFQQLDASFNRIWGVTGRPQGVGIGRVLVYTVRKKVFSFGMVLAVGVLLLVSVVLTGVTQALFQGVAQVPIVGAVMGTLGGVVVTLGLNSLIFALLFKYLPDVVVRWGDVWGGAVVTAVVWEVAKRLLAVYIGGSSYASAYGVVGTVLALMAWIYFSSQILFFGAEFTKVTAQQRRSAAMVPVVPALPAVMPLVRVAGHDARRESFPMATGVVVGLVGGAVVTCLMLLVGLRRAFAFLGRRRGGWIGFGDS